jgi:hypothetical protein
MVVSFIEVSVSVDAAEVPSRPEPKPADRYPSTSAPIIAGGFLKSTKIQPFSFWPVEIR